MRSEQEILELIVHTAKNDERIRAVIMNGSRVNPNAPRDIFQDFDIVYLVTEVASFRDDSTWINRFGDLMILQMPEAMEDPPPQNNGNFIYLMQFTDGNRIDLGLVPIANFNDLKADSLSVLLLDKDGVLKPFEPPNDSSYLPRPPTAKVFSDCCNEFWWVCPYIAKGLWREEIIYAKALVDQILRDQLLKLLAWHIGVKTGFSRNPGKLGKYFQQYLEPELWEMLQRTYADASYDHTWEALFVMGDLFRKVAVPLAEHFGFDYPHDDDQRVSAHLDHVRFLPKDAKEIY
jgi:aminoglycoside 6-adenylyltransferase